MNVNDKEKDKCRVAHATAEMEGARVLTAMRVDTGSEERGWYCI